MYLCKYVYMYMYICTYVYIYISIYLYIYIRIYVYMYIYIYMYLCMYVCLFIYIHIFTLCLFKSFQNILELASLHRHLSTNGHLILAHLIINKGSLNSKVSCRFL